ncbi:MAG: PAS domain-containing sensor histidine kinase [Flavobacteriaceae bacterium]|jgi:PAS domain S-box-containing protein|nr:PAS domain-containing sensor histidine kinase [Flavobacteriaceae bacterium]
MMKISGNYQHTLKLYNWTYIVALTVIALISFFSQVFIHNYLSNQSLDTRFLNYAAKLRSDSQSLVKYALLLEKGQDYKSNRKNFYNTFCQWKETYRSLREGNEFLSIPRSKNKEMEELFVIIDKPYNEMADASEAMYKVLSAHEGSADISAYVEILLKNEKTYLLGMEMIVFDYDRILRNNIKFLKKLEWSLFSIVIVCLIFEALVIFKPLSGKLKASFAGLVDTEKYSRKLIEQIQEANKDLEQSHKELREVNFALEKATYLVKTDACGNIIYANDKYCNVTRYSMAELRDKPLFYNNMGREKSIIYDHIENEEVKNEVWQGEIFDHASDGTGFWMNVTLMPIFNSKGQLYRYYAICFDITKTKQAEKEVHMLMEEKMKQKDELQRIRSESIIAGEERERKRIAAEIHDDIGQMLTALKMRMEIVEAEKQNSDRDLSEVKEIIVSIIHETRKICAELLPSVLDDFGLKAAINDLLKTIRSSTPLQVKLHDNMDSGLLTKMQETVIYRILQEATNNVIKHAQAKNIFITMVSDAENIYIKIQDDGIGFDLDINALYNRKVMHPTYGLISMKERADLLGADFKIFSKINEGTSIELEIPVQQV